eukprot:g2634.t1
MGGGSRAAMKKRAQAEKAAGGASPGGAAAQMSAQKLEDVRKRVEEKKRRAELLAAGNDMSVSFGERMKRKLGCVVPVDTEVELTEEEYQAMKEGGGSPTSAGGMSHANSSENEQTIEIVTAGDDKGRPQRRVIVKRVWALSVGNWIATPQADLFFASLILLNAIVLAIETDNRTASNEDDIGWFISDSIFNAAFLIEVALRLYNQRYDWPKDLWNLFDFTLVAVGVLDTWIMRFAVDDGDNDMRAVSVLRIFRLLRLMRVLRLIRLFRFLRELVLLANGIIGSFRALLWTGVLLCVALFICGMFLTRLIGQDDDTFHGEHVKLYFGTLMGSFFTLFQIMTLEGWAKIAREVMDDVPALAIFFICFILLTNMAIFNLVTAIIVDNVVECSKDMEEEKQLKEQEDRMEQLAMIRQLYHEMDTDGNGLMSWKELEQAPEHACMMAFGNACSKEELFRMLDVEGEGEIVIDDLVRAAMRVRDSVQSHHVLSLECDIRRVRKDIAEVKALCNLHVESAAAVQHEGFERYLRRVISDQVRKTMAEVLSDTRAAVTYL